MSGPDELAQLEAMKSYRSFTHGQEIVAAGEAMGFVASVVSGHVALRRTMADGRRQMVGLLFQSDFLGRPDRDGATYDAEAIGDVTLCRFERAKFGALLATSPNLQTRLLEMTMDELDASREWLLLLGRKTAREKIASFIALVGKRAGTLDSARPAEGAAFELPLSREDIAEYLGLTIETVSRQMSALRRDGLIDLITPRMLSVTSYQGLLDSAGDDPEPL